MCKVTPHSVHRSHRAVGVECVPNSQFHPLVQSRSLNVYAKKWVVVSGGSLGSPLILERSGIGAASVLRKNGVEQVVDLPGVGERYQGTQSRVSDLIMLYDFM